MNPEAFFTICDDAKPADDIFLSLYIDVPFYGGPEEGGWWGRDTRLIASRHFVNRDAAELAKALVQKEADSLNKDEKDSFGRTCLREMEWLDARGLDSDFLPEPDGESRYWVAIEKQRGGSEHRGCRHYE